MENKEEQFETIKPEFLERTYVSPTGTEVKLTGRVAKSRSRSGKVKILWETCPLSVAKNTPNNTVFNKWVHPLELFHIKGDNVLTAATKTANNLENNNDKT